MGEVLAALAEGRELSDQVRSCLERRVLVEPDPARDVLGGGEDGAAAEVSLVRGCERVVQVADGWIGEVDSECLLEALAEGVGLSERLCKWRGLSVCG